MRRRTARLFGDEEMVYVGKGLRADNLDDENWGTLWGRRRQFCARHTHSRFTFGADSTGRSESINSILKNHFNRLVHGKMRMMQLLPSVMKLEREANAKAELQNLLDQRSQNCVRTALPPIIADMKARVGVSVKGLELVASTTSRLLSYSVEANAPRPPAAPSFAASACARGCPPGRCTRQLDSARAPPASADGGAASGYLFECQPEPDTREYHYVFYSADSESNDADETESITPAELVCLDVGLETSLEDHIVSVDTCTCQGLAHFGLPCAHMLRLWFHLQIQRVPDGVVHRRWAEREGDDADLSARQERARRFRLNQSTAASAAVGGPHDPKALSGQEQYLSLFTKAKVLISAAARNKGMAASVHQILDAALTQLSDGDLGKKKSRGRKAARTAAAEHLEAEGAPAAAPAEANDDLAWIDDPPKTMPIVRIAPESASVRRRNVAGTTQRASGNKGPKPAGSGGK
ncbi:hypothetical protein T492DRAFT_1138618 [Pavlovales sp. CCMP2436]|nr:hypothetical protein T492DRAFT_1138618 [Pavlovales sp. CCMP2436]